jgi:hypothetical protein
MRAGHWLTGSCLAVEECSPCRIHQRSLRKDAAANGAFFGARTLATRDLEGPLLVICRQKAVVASICASFACARPLIRSGASLPKK